jgi:hypothetical protein
LCRNWTAMGVNSAAKGVCLLTHRKYVSVMVIRYPWYRDAQNRMTVSENGEE